MDAKAYPQPKPVREVMRRATKAEQASQRQARVAAESEASAARDRQGAERLAVDLAEMRADRDHWRAQAERLATALERLKGPFTTALAPALAAPVDQGAHVEREDSDLLYGAPAIAAFLGVGERQARHLADVRAIPTFKLPGNKIICARRSSLNSWLAEREAASHSGVN